MIDNKSVVVLIAEDDDDDFLLTKRAFQKLKISNQVHRVCNGQELLDYLRNEGAYTNKENNPRAHLVLLDLNMPVMDGREALEKIKSDANLKDIVVVVFTTSQEQEDKIISYKLGVNSFIRKPVKHQDFIDVISMLKKYWIDTVDLPE